VSDVTLHIYIISVILNITSTMSTILCSTLYDITLMLICVVSVACLLHYTVWYIHMLTATL